MRTMEDPLISVRNLSYSYPSSVFRKRRMALSEVSLDIYEGEKVAVIGPSGSGKSTLIQSLNGLIPNCRKGRMTGSVFIGGMDTVNTSVTEISSVTGFVFQDPDHQIVRNDVDSEIAFGLEQAGYASPEIERRISEITSLMNIGHLRGREITEISWGEKQKVAIASVLVLNPKILILDEPLSGLDSDSAKSLLMMLESVNKSGNISIIIVEHRLDYLGSFADRIILMDSGKIIRDCPAASFFKENGSVGDIFMPASQSGNSGQDIDEISNPFSGRADCTYPGPPVVIENVTFAYPGKDKPLLNNINAEFYPGEAVAIFGPNGSGKSTLAKHLNGLLRPLSGRVIIFGEDISGCTVAETSEKVALLSQHADYQLFAETIEEELAFGPSNLGFDPEKTAALTASIISLLDLGHLGKKARPLNLSVGEKQRVAIAGYLVMDTPVIVLDEPTLGLDYRLKENLSRTICMLKKSGRTIITFTHDREFADSFADRSFRIDEGRLNQI